MKALLFILLLATLPVAAQKAPPAAPSEPTAQPIAPTRWHAVLVAGDASLQVWDRAVEVMGNGLREGGNTTSIRAFSARPDRIQRGAERADPRAVLNAIAGLRPAAGEGCFIFMTMHGDRGAGLVLPEANAVIGPAALDRALSQGCGQAPTVVVTSGCYTGIFAQEPMARPNRAIYTAARPDRSSFGCAPQFAVTVYDGCLIAEMARATAPAALGQSTAECVRREEVRQNMNPPSGPQMVLGAGAPLSLPRFTPRKPDA